MPPRFLGRRSSGLLLHPTSLPGPGGIGELGPSAVEFVAFLSAAGQSWWQMLPVVPPGAGNSPYSSPSAFAGSPLLVSLEGLVGEGWLAPEAASPRRGFGKERTVYASARRHKETALRLAYAGFLKGAGVQARRELEEFKEENRFWLGDFSLFSVLRRRSGRIWTRWEEGLRLRRPEALAEARSAHAEELGREEFIQWCFQRQWDRLKARAGELGVGFMGDIPLYLAHDSADVWADQAAFQLDAGGNRLAVAGVPPDYFSKTGQLWGNPLYRWDAMRADGYAWWSARLKRLFRLFDAVRLDHFIGFHNYWSIPAGETTAVAGEWLPGPGAPFFDKILGLHKNAQFVAEDLGAVTPGVAALRDRFGFPGMRVLQFTFPPGPALGTEAPPERTVVYTGTHDNDTTVGWFKSHADPSSILWELGTDGREIHWDMIETAFRLSAVAAVIPVQDVLGLGTGARMNTPSIPLGNWDWRLAPGVLTPDLAARLRALTVETGRL